MATLSGVVATKDSLIRVRLSSAERALLEARCARDSVSISEYVRVLIRENERVWDVHDQQVAAGNPVDGSVFLAEMSRPSVEVQQEMLAEPVMVDVRPVVGKRYRTELCVHRVPATEFCKRCD